MRQPRTTPVNAGFSFDGKRLATLTPARAIHLWDAGDGRRTHVLRGHTGPIASIAFSPDGRRVLTASWDGTARIWDGDRGASLPLVGHSNVVSEAVFNNTGSSVMTSSWDGSLRLWDASTGALLRVYQDVAPVGSEERISFMAWRETQGLIVAASQVGTSGSGILRLAPSSAAPRTSGVGRRSGGVRPRSGHAPDLDGVAKRRRGPGSGTLSAERRSLNLTKGETKC